MTLLGKAKAIGWDGMTLNEMLEKSERLLRETGRYYGTEKLAFKQKDPIHYERLFSKIRGSLVNARETALNISASPIVKEIGELCFSLYTPEGDSVALSTGIIVHVHTMSDAIKHMIRSDYESNPRINPGDIFCNNDPFIGDVHNADVQTLVPIFWEGELVGWAGGVTHEIDIGAGRPGSVPYGHTTSFEDGLRIPCEKIGEDDTLYRSYELRCQKGVRLPMYWLLDERTRIAGCHMIRDAVHRILAEEGIDTYRQFVREVIEEGRRSFITQLQLITVPGKYSAPAFFDVPWEGERELQSYAARDTMMHAPLELSISGDGEFNLSFDGANAWGFHSFNAPPSAMQGALWVLLTQTLIPNDKVNDGAYFATRINLPPGTWCNPVNQMASTSLSWAFLMPSFTGLFRTLGRAYQARGYVEEIVAGFPPSFNTFMGGGTDHYGNEGAAFTNFEQSCGGTGASAIKDGEGYCAAMWNPEGDMGDVEAWEILEPVLYLGRRVKPNSAGMGKYRGGSGFEGVRMCWNTNDQVFYNVGEGHVFHGGGLFGGYPAASGYRHNINDTNMAELIANRLPYPAQDYDPENSEMDQLVAGKVTKDTRALTLPTPFKQGDLYLNFLKGGHGVGDPLEREPAAVENDLNEGFFLPRLAERVYGAVVTQTADGTWQVDPAATAQCREQIRSERKQQAVPVSEWLAAQRERVQRQEFIKPVREMYRSSMQLSQEWAGHFRRFWNLPDDFSF